MTNHLLSGRSRIISKVWRLFLLIVVLMTVLLFTQPALAQTEDKTELTLRLYNALNSETVPATAAEDNRFFLEVKNTGTRPITNIKLSVQSPEGWIITIYPAAINSLSPGSLNALDVNIRPAGKATSYMQLVTFTAQANEIQNVKSSFNVAVFPAVKAATAWARTELILSLLDGQNNYYYSYSGNEIKAGEDNTFLLEVRNTGTELITDIRLSSEAPEGWTIEIKPLEISSLSSGSSSRVDVNIKPVGKATKEQQEVTFIAQSTEIQNVKTTFFLTVKPAQVWIWVWIAAGVVIVFGFVLVYLRFGKQ